MLWQDGREVLRCGMTDVKALDRLLSLFFACERPEIAEFRKAVEQFKTDLPPCWTRCATKIDEAYARQRRLSARRRRRSSTHAQETINPALSEADVREMLIQHILTEEIFAKVFDDSDFHRENNVAQELYALEGDVLHRRGEARHAEGAGALLRGDPQRPPRRSPATTRSRPSSR